MLYPDRVTCARCALCVALGAASVEISVNVYEVIDKYQITHCLTSQVFIY